MYICTHIAGWSPVKIQIYDLFYFTRILEFTARQSLGKFGTVAAKLNVKRYLIFYFKNILRGGAVAARWAHNPKVAGSSPVPATKKDSSSDLMGSFLFLPTICQCLKKSYQIFNFLI